MALYIPPNPLYNTPQAAANALVSCDKGFINVLSGQYYYVTDPYLERTYHDTSKFRFRTTAGKNAAVGETDQFRLLSSGMDDVSHLPCYGEVSLEEAAQAVATEAGWGPMDQRRLSAALAAARCAADDTTIAVKGGGGRRYVGGISREYAGKSGFLFGKDQYRFAVSCHEVDIRGVRQGNDFGFNGDRDVYESELDAQCGLACLLAVAVEDASALRRRRGAPTLDCYER